MGQSDLNGVKLLLVGIGIGLVIGGAIGFLYAKVSILSSGTEIQAPPQTIITPTTTRTPAPTTTTTRTPAPIADVNMKELVDDDPWFGNPDAKVVIVEFSDFQCPFCARATPTVKQIEETYGDEILFVYRDFPIHSIHPQAQKAGEAAQCAFEQDLFWDYHDLLFEKQQEWSAAIGVAKFKEYAATLNLDTEEFNNCLDTDKYAMEVGDDLNAGQEVGVTGTPTFFINGRKLVGAQPFTSFQNIIDQELATVG
jgi:protein-disulfide isomerase